jgi:hypothetical protein
MVCPSFWEDYYMLIYAHCWELMNSVGSHGSSSLPFMMKVMVCHFGSDSHEVMTAPIVVLPLIVVVEISLQLHRSLFTHKITSGSPYYYVGASKTEIIIHDKYVVHQAEHSFMFQCLYGTLNPMTVFSCDKKTFSLGICGHRRGAIVTTFIVCYALTSFISGYVGGAFYSRNDGEPTSSLNSLLNAQSRNGNRTI